MDSDVERSYWDIPSTEQTESNGGEGLGSIEEAPPAAPMVGTTAETAMDEFDFDGTWQTSSDGYPDLRDGQEPAAADTVLVTIQHPVADAEVDESDPLQVLVDVINVGTEETTQEIELSQPVTDTATVELAPGERDRLEFHVPENVLAGTVTVAAESESDADSISVTATDPCFIATAAYNTPHAEEIDVLREFRDSVLDRHSVGRLFIDLYYRCSPPIADWLRQSPRRRYLVREIVVGPLVAAVERFGQTGLSPNDNRGSN